MSVLRRIGSLTAMLIAVLGMAGSLADTARATSTTLTVNDPGDATGGDDTTCDVNPGLPGNQCTLREALGTAGNLPSSDTVVISLTGVNGATISPSSTLDVTRSLTIDGCGAVAGPNPCVGVASSGQRLLNVTANDVTIRGVAVSDASSAEGIFVTGTGFHLAGSWIGMHLNGTAGANLRGLELRGDGALIGGTTVTTRNVFANNSNSPTNTAVGLQVRGPDDVVIEGNYFGTDPAGAAAAANSIDIAVTDNGSSVPANTSIGGTLDSNALASGACDGACNLISGATISGVDIAKGSSDSTSVRGNYIGVDAGGAAPIANQYGVFVAGLADGVIVGGPAAGDRNVISGPEVIGVYDGSVAKPITIQGNLVGLNAAGTAALPAINDGIDVNGSIAAPATVRDNRVVGAAGTGSAMSLDGIGAIVEGNAIGLGPGNQPLPTGGGVRVTGSGNHIGGSAAGQGNTIANVKLIAAIYVDGGDDNLIQGNTIGLAGASNFAGVMVRTYPAGVDANDNVIGGDQPGEANAISYSVHDGVLISGAGTGNRVLRNTGVANGEDFIDVGAYGAGAGDGFPTTDGSNGGATAPTIVTASTLGAGGTATPGAVVRVFTTLGAAGSRPHGLATFAGSATAGALGTWSVAYASPLANAAAVTASQTLTSNSTGELAGISLSADATPPQTSVDSGPAGPTASRTPSFTFSSSEAGSTFQCRIDQGAFAPCASGAAFGPLTEGDHTFQARATDPAANTDSTPASRSFRVDTTPPGTTITAGPVATRSPTPVFKFASSETGSHFECRVDDAAFSACVSPDKTAKLRDGRHTFAARSIDGVGHVDATPAQRMFRVDTTAPVVRLIRRSAAASRSGISKVIVVCDRREASGPCRGSIAAVASGVSYAKASFRLKPGKRTALTLRISRAGRSTLARTGRVRARVNLDVRDAFGNRRKTHLTLTIVRR